MHVLANDEYADFYANYISKVPNGDLLNFLDLQPGEFVGLVNDLTDEQAIEAAGSGQVEREAGTGASVRYGACDGLSHRCGFARGDQKELQGL